MKIELLGTRGEIEAKASRHNRHSGILIDDILLIDVGEKSFLDKKPTYIFFTHLHPDHAWFVRNNEFFEYPEGKVFSPEKSYLLKEYTTLTQPVTIEGYTITPVPTIHSIKVKSQGYIVEKNNQRVFYSSDMVWVEKQYHHLLQQLDLVITDGSFIRKGGAIRRHADKIVGHNGIPDLIRFFEKFTHHIVFVHFGSWFMDDVAESKKKIHALQHEGLTIEVGYDGKVIRL